MCFMTVMKRKLRCDNLRAPCFDFASWREQLNSKGKWKEKVWLKISHFSTNNSWEIVPGIFAPDRKRIRDVKKGAHSQKARNCPGELIWDAWVADRVHFPLTNLPCKFYIENTRINTIFAILCCFFLSTKFFVSAAKCFILLRCLVILLCITDHKLLKAKRTRTQPDF